MSEIKVNIAITKIGGIIIESDCAPLIGSVIVPPPEKDGISTIIIDPNGNVVFKGSESQHYVISLRCKWVQTPDGPVCK